jgi:hypothetical protein
MLATILLSAITAWLGAGAGIERSRAMPLTGRSAECVNQSRRCLESKHQHCDHQNNSYAEWISFRHPKHREVQISRTFFALVAQR